MTHLDATQLTTIYLGLVWFELILICSLELRKTEENLKETTVIESENLTKILEMH